MDKTGGCLCGAVRYRTTGDLRPVVYCHCGQCRRTGGHFGAFTSVAEGALALTEAGGLAWFESSPGVRRGFCRDCGSSLFWQRVGNGRISVAAGTLDDDSGLVAAGHIFAQDKGGYYAIDDGLPVFDESSGGVLPESGTAGG
ncbi:MAG: GFA family protein [Geminicoccaceae bacterium]|nr:GFA family protein [Geminicoccaceae bacterium]